MKTIVSLFWVFAAIVMMSAAGCHKDPSRPAEGPMERAGRKVDDAADKTKDETKDAAGKAESDAKDAKETIKKKTK